MNAFFSHKATLAKRREISLSQAVSTPSSELRSPLFPRRFRVLASVAVLLWLPSLSPPAAAAEMTLYSSRGPKLIKPLIEAFSKRTGIEVKLLTAKAGALIRRLEIEGTRSPADVLLTVDAGQLHLARTKGVLQKARINRFVPPYLRDPEHYWYGLSKRARVIVHAPDRVSVNELSTYENLASKKWRGRLCLRSSDNIYNQSLVASMIAQFSESYAERWAQGLVANLAAPPSGNDRAQIAAVAAGVCDLSLVNTYYMGIMTTSDDPGQAANAAKVRLFFPNQRGRGTHINVSGAGVAAHAPNRSGAIRFIEFLLSPEGQNIYASSNFEYPVTFGIEPDALVRSWGWPFKQDPLPMQRLGVFNPAAVLTMDRAGWR